MDEHLKVIKEKIEPNLTKRIENGRLCRNTKRRDNLFKA